MTDLRGKPDNAGSGTALWHPFANMAEISGAELVITRGEGVWLYDDGGKRYLDASASLWYANVGHGRSEIAEAVATQIETLEAYSIFGATANPPAIKLAERLSSLSPLDGAKVFLTTGGGEAVDSAAKIARSYWQAVGQPTRQHLIGRIAGYHGSNGFGTSIGGIEPNRAGFGALIPHVSQVPYDSVDALEREIQRIGAENVAAFFMEPVIAAGGVLHPPDGYIEGVAEVCAANGVLFIVDAVVCGFGRLGTWFGIERWGVEPDMILFAKGVSSGYLPVGGVVASWKVSEPFFTSPGYMLRHGATYSGHQAAAVAALVNLEILERENLFERARELEDELDAVLRPLEEHPLVTEVRAGIGLMAAVEVTAPALAPRIHAGLCERGILARALGTAIAFSPPLTVGADELASIGAALQETLESVLAEVAPETRFDQRGGRASRGVGSPPR